MYFHFLSLHIVFIYAHCCGNLCEPSLLVFFSITIKIIQFFYFNSLPHYLRDTTTATGQITETIQEHTANTKTQ